MAHQSTLEGQVQLLNAKAEAERLAKIYKSIGERAGGSDLARQAAARLMEAEAALLVYRNEAALLDQFDIT